MKVVVEKKLNLPKFKQVKNPFRDFIFLKIIKKKPNLGYLQKNVFAAMGFL